MKYTKQEEHLATMLFCADIDETFVNITPRIRRLAKQYARDFYWYCFRHRLLSSLKALPQTISISISRKISIKAAHNVALSNIYLKQQEEYYK